MSVTQMSVSLASAIALLSASSLNVGAHALELRGSSDSKSWVSFQNTTNINWYVTVSTKLEQDGDGNTKNTDHVQTRFFVIPARNADDDTPFDTTSMEGHFSSWNNWTQQKIDDGDIDGSFLPTNCQDGYNKSVIENLGETEYKKAVYQNYPCKVATGAFRWTKGQELRFFDIERLNGRQFPEIKAGEYHDKPEFRIKMDDISNKSKKQSGTYVITSISDTGSSTEKTDDGKLCNENNLWYCDFYRNVRVKNDRNNEMVVRKYDSVGNQTSCDETIAVGAEKVVPMLVEFGYDYSPVKYLVVDTYKFYTQPTDTTLALDQIANFDNDKSRNCNPDSDHDKNCSDGEWFEV